MATTNLTRTEAEGRSTLIDVASYDVTLDLTSEEKTFGSVTEVVFTAEQDGDTFIDFVDGTVTGLELNGESLDAAGSYDGARIALTVRSGENRLRVEGTGTYMNTGEGLHRFVDPVDNEVYLYSQFEVADCRRMFAVWDQPDLKATFRFTVTAPAHWQIVSNQPTPEPQPAEHTWRDPSGNERPTATWSFGATPVMSSYITALVAGPYDVVRDSVSTRRGEVPLAIYCRRSLSEFLDSDNVFDCTKRGFEFFENEFDCEYPFEKYDQIFTPEYNAGAMENAGCVTFNEIYIFRSKVSDAKIERRALTILHELAHMWFGDLVTMKWWNDLWLNESFAEWASTVCQAEATEWDEAWTTFSILEKTWAYNQDQLSSTHPIVADIGDLEDVESNFDGITYAKGASVLKQLVAYVGRDRFVQGLRSYFAKYAWGNTTLPDLLTELADASGRDLKAWSALWLETAGVNTLTPKLETGDDGTISSFVIEQTATEELPTLRPHRLAVGCYERQGDSWVRTNRVEVDVDGASTSVDALVGTTHPGVILLNDDDLAYAKIRLDDASMAAVIEQPEGFDSLPRALVLGALWDMTRDAQLRGRDLVSVLQVLVGKETHSGILRMMLTVLRQLTELYISPDAQDEVRAHVTATLREAASQAAPGSDAQLQLTEAFAAYASTKDDVALVRGLLSGQESFEGLAIDQDLRWSLLTSLAAAGAAQEDEIAAEEQKDATASGKERAALVRAALPTPEAKAEAWSKLVETPGLPNQTIEAIGKGLQRVHDRQLLAPYADKYFAMLTSMWADRTFHIGQSIANLAFPVSLTSPDLLGAAQQWLDENASAPAGLVRVVTEHRDDVQRALTAQAYDATL
ncbi:aminopeptidase N [Yimella sp. RIT 621]|uniref:Aminopeptidase N n=1 Tax=Yimella lutea TaxID=587872 RepID=A0A542EFB5_9MICO|nr:MULTISPECIES: aminopeptidase N [Yimella]RYG77993.1 aminopeptidase N [Yimella sp. RIT 621]TQJ14027.1 aminopeptidase N [Yimella lutea]